MTSSLFVEVIVNAVSIIKIERLIYVIRDQKVILDNDLASLYEIETKKFNQAVKRNLKRFPEDFMFQLSDEEFEKLQSHSSSRKYFRHGGRRFLPYAFTEQGVAMLSSILNSDNAIEINISIMRTFVRLRQFLAENESIADKIENLEKGTTKLFRVVFERLDNLESDMPLLPTKRKKIGLKE